jgi:copper(I)-binding protein
MTITMATMPTAFHRVQYIVLRTAFLALLASANVGSQVAHAGEEAKRPLVQVDNAWIRASVKGQSGTGGFMDVTASKDLSLTGFSSPAARDSELHEMAMDGAGVMRMRPVGSLALPAGQTVSLRPGMGSHHLMLMGLKRELKEGDRVALTLQLRSADGRRLTQKIMVPVKKAAPSTSSPSSSGAGMPADHSHNHHD